MTTELYSVYRDEHMHTCIKLPDKSSKQVCFIPMDPLEVAVKSLPAREFYDTYKPMEAYPVKRAAELYLYTEKFKQFSDEARRHLERIVADPAYVYTADNLKPIKPPVTKEITMTEATATTAAPAKKVKAPVVNAKAAAKAADKAAPAAKKSAAKADAAPAKKAKDANKADGKKPAKTEAAAPATRAGKFSPDAKITLLVKENPKRAGTKAHAVFELYKTCKTVGAFLEDGGISGYLSHDVKIGLVSVADKK